MANKCKVCKKYISQTDGIKCIKCVALFHPLCLKLTPGYQVPSKWKCDNCKGTKFDNKALTSSSNQSPLEVRDQDVSRDTSSTVESSHSGLAEEVRQVIRAEMSSFREDFARICMTISDLSRRVDTIETRLTDLEEQFSADRERSKVQEESENINEIISQLHSQLNDREQEYFMNDIEVSGIPEKHGENLMHVTILIGKKLGVDLEERDVVSAERLGPRRAVVEGEGQARPRTISVRLARRALRDQLLRAARVRRGADTQGIVDGSLSRFYLNERLTRTNKQIFYNAREEGRRKGWRYVWTSGGRIFIRRDANATAHRIRNEADIKKFFLGYGG